MRQKNKKKQQKKEVYQEGINLASIDIGTNGARLLIKCFNDHAPIRERIRKVMFVRIPLRLGLDVFSIGKISKEREFMMIQMVKGFKHFMKLNHVTKFRACATSAMRDAENGEKIIKNIEHQTGIRLQIVKGEEEARLLYNNLVERTDSNAGNLVYMDVGGGSTEVSLLCDGELICSKSYNVGTLRMLNGKVKEDILEEFESDMKQFANQYSDIQIIGSGGNINKLNKLSHHNKKTNEIQVTELKRIYEILKGLCLEERIISYHLKADRADVIIPAAEIFLKAAQWLKCASIIVPNISLADSIVDGLYRDWEKENAVTES